MNFEEFLKEENTEEAAKRKAKDRSAHLSKLNSRPAFGDDWNAHAKVKDQEHHQMHAKKHHAAEQVLAKTIERENLPSNHPTTKKADQHLAWARAHEVQARKVKPMDSRDHFATVVKPRPIKG